MTQQTYTVSALKYRPSSWETIIGQDNISTTLRQAIDSNQLAQAYLFCGPRGVGKTSTARLFAREINLKHDSLYNKQFNLMHSAKNHNDKQLSLMDGSKSSYTNKKHDFGNRFSFIDLFAGIGGFRLGLEALDVDCLFSSEWDLNAKKNNQKNCFCDFLICNLVDLLY